MRVATRLRFEALHYADRLQTVNPYGDVGVVTLWSPLRTARRKLDAIDAALLDPERSRIAVMANLYGDGLFGMLANLLHNPQVRHLVAIGEGLGLPTTREIEAFLRDGLEDVEVLGRPMRRIAGTSRLLPAVDGFDADRLRRTLTFRAFGKLSRLGGELVEHLDALPSDPPEDERVAVPLPPAEEPPHRPSRVEAHQVVRRRPLDCWEELVVRTLRFGRPVELRDGPRLELLDVKAVIAEPADDPDDALARHGFDPADLRAYAERMLRAELPEDVAYTYGNRLHGALHAAAATLRADPESRRAYVSIWDAEAAPCLTTLSFRRSDGALALTATFRSHNLLDGWLRNAYGLMAIQRRVATAAGMPPGAITIVSHSLGIDPRAPRYELARAIERAWDRDDDREGGKSTLRHDPHGYFVVSSDPARGTIVAEHRHGGMLVKRYEAQRAVTIENAVAADMAVSLVSHALWLGRELTRHEGMLRCAS